MKGRLLNAIIAFIRHYISAVQTRKSILRGIIVNGRCTSSAFHGFKLQTFFLFQHSLLLSDAKFARLPKNPSSTGFQAYFPSTRDINTTVPSVSSLTRDLSEYQSYCMYSLNLSTPIDLNSSSISSSMRTGANVTGTLNFTWWPTRPGECVASGDAVGQ